MPTASRTAARFPVPTASRTGADDPAPLARPWLRAALAALAAAPPHPVLWLFAPWAASRSYGSTRRR